MRLIALVGAALCLAATAAEARPVGTPISGFAEAPVEQVHHKPGHRGGPPWTRERRRPDRFDEGQAYGGRGYEGRGYGSPYGDSYRSRVVVERCVTRYEERYDPYRDAYVRRPVRVCR